MKCGAIEECLREWIDREIDKIINEAVLDRIREQSGEGERRGHTLSHEGLMRDIFEGEGEKKMEKLRL